MTALDTKAGQTKPGVDELEVVPGFEHEKLEGSVWESASEAELLEALEKAFSYRGDITILLRGGRELEGYLFDRSFGPTLAESRVRLILRESSKKAAVLCSEIAGLKFTGRDTAAGKSWEAWVKKYWEKKAAGEKNIQLAPENLD